MPDASRRVDDVLGFVIDKDVERRIHLFDGNRPVSRQFIDEFVAGQKGMLAEEGLDPGQQKGRRLAHAREGRGRCRGSRRLLIRVLARLHIVAYVGSGAVAHIKGRQLLPPSRLVFLFFVSFRVGVQRRRQVDLYFPVGIDGLQLFHCHVHLTQVQQTVDGNFFQKPGDLTIRQRLFLGVFSVDAEVDGLFRLGLYRRLRCLYRRLLFSLVRRLRLRRLYRRLRFSLVRRLRLRIGFWFRLRSSLGCGPYRG